MPRRLQLAARYQYERWRGLIERELPLFCSQINRHDVVVDVGANVGIYVHALRKRGAIVEAFEPQPACSAILQAYATVDPAVHVHPVALGSAVSKARLSVPIEHGRLARGSATMRTVSGTVGEITDVDVRTLDSFEFERVDAIKIDVEGAELDVLRGATATLRRARPLLLVEIEQRHHAASIEGVFTWLEDMDYEGQVLLPGRGLRPTRDFDPEEHQQLDEDGRPTATYVNNFLFRVRR
jgi:FkbM family methyltransferase